MLQDSTKQYILLSFDVDDTVAESKQKMPEKMVKLFAKLILKYKIHFISGGKYSLMVANTISPIIKEFLQDSNSLKPLENIYFSPTVGAALYFIDTKFFAKNNYTAPECPCYIQVYAKKISLKEFKRIKEVFDKVLRQFDFIPKQTYGEQLEYRETTVAFSALGQEAPVEKKKPFDPDKTKRKLIVEALKPLLPEYHIQIGGSTTIDIMQKGISKGMGVGRLVEFLGIPKDSVLFFGDSIFEGGNDYSVYEAGFDVVKVKNWQDTYKYLQQLI